ncbi:SDR family oxidoreductase [Mastigocoleus testarum]|uniref:NAD(P)-dependent oxidoreductase n=1 Tax=Mastigocoleus testarum BC008 TaxID=371196 RepID=A0A0V7ZBZ8_9CYAN|nr:SDR family oxidoreductase [Mastigocoleus testarum]KST61868.1 NAD(P)-dependent oxidoreductase [Mastigocoleus testarum BC008]
MQVKNRPTVLVLGATGKVGSKVARLLVESGDLQVIAGVRSPEKAKSLQEQGIEIRHLDLDKQNTLEPVLKGIDRALLLTGYTVNMLKQSKAFLDIAKQTGVKHIVHIGASGAPTNEVAHWGWHQYIEKYIESLEFSYTHLRPEAFMKNITDFGWLNKDVITNYIGDARWSWVDSDDLALVTAETLRQPEVHAGKIYPLAYDTATMSEVAEILTEVIGKPYRVETRSPEDFLENMLKLGAEATYIHCVYTQLKLNIANEIPNADATFDNFEAITGCKPTSWWEFVEKNREELIY